MSKPEVWSNTLLSAFGLKKRGYKKRSDNNTIVSDLSITKQNKPRAHDGLICVKGHCSQRQIPLGKKKLLEQESNLHKAVSRDRVYI